MKPNKANEKAIELEDFNARKDSEEGWEDLTQEAKDLKEKEKNTIEMGEAYFLEEESKQEEVRSPRKQQNNKGKQTQSKGLGK